MAAGGLFAGSPERGEGEEEAAEEPNLANGHHPPDEEQLGATAPHSPARRVHRTAEERKQRRLETNRAAAKRAYYRRQGKMNALKHENGQLRKLTEAQAERLVLYERLLARLGCADPNAELLG